MVLETIRGKPWVQFVLLSIAAICLFFLFWWSADILVPFLLAFILAYILDPAVDWMTFRFGLSRMTSILILLVFVTLVLMVLGYFLVEEAIVFGQQVQDLLQEPPDVRGWIQQFLPDFLTTFFDTFAGDTEGQSLYERLMDLFRRNLSELASGLTGSTRILNLFVTRTIGVLNFLINAVVVVFATIYMLRDFDGIIRGIREEIPYRYRERTDQIFAEINELSRAFLRGHLIICLVVGVLYGLGYLLIGLKGGLLIGFLSGLMNVIPYAGSSLGFLLAFIMALAQFGFNPWVLTVAAVFVVVQFFEGNVLRPTILGAAVGMNPVVVIFALMFFGKLMGFLGLLLAVPIACIFKVFLEHLREIYHDTEFYGEPGR